MTKPWAVPFIRNPAPFHNRQHELSRMGRQVDSGIRIPVDLRDD